MDAPACYLCGSHGFEPVAGKVRDKPELGILRCTGCGLVFLENFDHVDGKFYESAYTEANHPDQDWRQLLDECRVDDERRAGQILPLVAKRRYLDVGCGAGGVLMRAQPHCAAVAGVEPQSRWRAELRAQGIAVQATLEEIADASFDLITLFHVLEHVPDPIAFLDKVRTKIAPLGSLFIEVPNADDALLKLYRCKSFSEFTYWSPHLFLYNASTLALLLDKAGFKGGTTIQQYQRYPLSNHLMWLAQGQPGGHQKWRFLDTPDLTAAYAAQLAALGMCDTLIAIVSLN